jgi:putative transposase
VPGTLFARPQVRVGAGQRKWQLPSKLETAMPRRRRLLLPGVPLHIIQVGHNHESCFHHDGDYLTYLALLGEHASSTGCAIHAYVLMTNHVHILASFDEPHGASDLIRLLGQQYSVYLNYRLNRSGTVWGGRYWSCPVPTEKYFFICQRYIELNPVRAGTGSQQGYRWSSFRGNAGLREDRLLSPHQLYLGLGISDAERQCHYRKLSSYSLSEEEIADFRAAMKENTVPESAGNRPGRPKKRR